MPAQQAPRLVTGSPPTNPAAYRVALVHSFYSSRRPSGENAAVLDQAEALRAAGHDVTLVAAHTDALESERGYTLRAAVRVATGRGRSPLPELRRLGPDVVHVHNLFPNFATDWLDRWPGAVVATLHNYRPVCAAATLFRDGKMCTACPDGDRWTGLRHGCYRGRRGATLPLAWAGRRGAAAHPLLRRAQRLVTLSERSRELYLRFGAPPEKLALVPNFVGFGGPADPEDRSTEASGADPATDPGAATRWVYAGRLSEEKGILPLLRSWPESEPLDVIGSGPLESACREAASGGVRLLGALPRREVTARLPRYTGLVFPSVCPESATALVCQEALAAGVPVLALAGSAAADSVRGDGTGAVYDGPGDLPHVLATARERFPRLREHCRRVHAERYSARSWTAAMESVYAQALAHTPLLRPAGVAERAW
ncbi:glycosyltransferase family 4 protein [Streptomyces sp. NPDC049887]|uniref:glycosyltransferase family 4 protein n=1 Tax=unclassified Streptomyces TaxID=2593676 RepID=UPI00343BAE46